MEEIETFKALLGPVAANYSEAELRQLRYEMYTVAELLLDIYLDERRKNVKQHPDAHF
jgi:hypothetical protein